MYVCTLAVTFRLTTFTYYRKFSWGAFARAGMAVTLRYKPLIGHNWLADWHTLRKVRQRVLVERDLIKFAYVHLHSDLHALLLNPISFTVEEECCRTGALYALESPTEILACRNDPALTCDSSRDDLCCECCNLGTLSFNAANEVGCEINRLAVVGDCRVVFEECCYGRGNHLLVHYSL